MVFRNSDLRENIKCWDVDRILEQGLDWTTDESSWRWMTTRELCKELGLLPSHYLAMEQKLNWLEKDEKIERCKTQQILYHVPPIKGNPAIHEKEEREKQQIDHPDYYKAGGVEAIDAIEAWGLGFCLGNVVKYIARAGRKNDDALTDLKKARWYLDKEIKEREEKADD